MGNAGVERGALRVLYTMEDRLWKEERHQPDAAAMAFELGGGLWRTIRFGRWWDCCC